MVEVNKQWSAALFGSTVTYTLAHKTRRHSENSQNRKRCVLHGRAAAIACNEALAITPCVIQSGIGRKIVSVYIAVCVISSLFTKWPCKSAIVEKHTHAYKPPPPPHTYTHTYFPLCLFLYPVVRNRKEKGREIVWWWSSFNACIYSSFFPPSFCISLQKSISEFNGGFRWAHDTLQSASAHLGVWYLIIHCVQRWNYVV